MTIGQNIQFLREKSGFSVPDLAKEIGVEIPTSVQESTDKNNIMEQPEEVYRNIVEGNTEYLLIPRSVLQEKYRLVSMEQYEKDLKEMAMRERELERRDKQIDSLFEIIKGMTSNSSLPVNGSDIQKAQ